MERTLLTGEANSPPRFAAIVASSDELSPESMSRIMGVRPDGSRTKGTRLSDLHPLLSRTSPLVVKSNRWELRESGGHEIHLTELIERLLSRSFPLLPRWLDLKSAGCTLVLQVVQDITAADAFGPGFHIETEGLQFLGQLGAALDVDQYVDFE